MKAKIRLGATALVVTAIVVLAGFAYGSLFSQPPTSSAENTAEPKETRNADEGCLGELAFRRHAYDIALREFLSRTPHDPRAGYYLGTMYERGLGVARNNRSALKWYLRAAGSGDRDAAFALGLIFLNGRDDLPKNYSEAFAWFKRAAERGHVEAQFNVGTMYRDGRGVAQDREKGLVWLMLASDQGENSAAELLVRDGSESNAALRAKVATLREQVENTMRKNTRERTGCTE